MPYIPRLFARIQAIYPEFNPEDQVYQDWRDELSGLSLDDIKRGIDRLDREKYCPTPSVFRELCDAPAKEVIKTLQEPPGLSPRPSNDAAGMSGSKAWAYRIRDRFLSGEKLSTIQLAMAEHVTGKFRDRS